MKLPDFNRDKAFLDLRRRMRVTKVAALESVAWTRLKGAGIDVPISEIASYNDGTLIYTDSDGQQYRVLVYIRDQYVERFKGGYRFHVAECDKLQEMRRKKRFSRYVATTRDDGLFVVNHLALSGQLLEKEQEKPLLVCSYCLKRLNWEGVNSNRTKLEGIRKRFTPHKFFERYSSQIVIFPVHDEYTAPLNTYSDDWDRISTMVKTRARWTCEECGRSLSAPEDRRFLHVHHVNGDRSDNETSNLRTLCIYCHALQPDHHHLTMSNDYKQYVIQFTPRR